MKKQKSKMLVKRQQIRYLCIASTGYSCSMELDHTSFLAQLVERYPVQRTYRNAKDDMETMDLLIQPLG